MSDGVTAYPLAWPPGWPRTSIRGAGPYRTALSAALNNLHTELRALCGHAAAQSLVLSSNVTLGNETPTDTGVVAYFTWEKQEMAIPCDRWGKVAHNVQAIALTLAAMRAMERHGAKHMIKAMFQGFKALLAPSYANWRSVLGIDLQARVTADLIQKRRRELATRHHPDVGGYAERMAEINAAADAALKEIANG